MAPGPASDLLDLALVASASDDGAGTVSVLAKLSGKGTVPEGARIVTRFGDIVAVEIPRRQLIAFADSEAVENVEIPRPLHAARGIDTHPPGTQIVPSTRRPHGVQATGRGTVVAVLDWGIDFAHESLLTRDGDGRPRTRLLGLWDQRGGDTTANRWGYGRVFTRDQIDLALLSDDPYRALGYHPGAVDTRDKRTGRWQGAHGTHVIDIAAGNGRCGGPVGVAPEADLLFCHLARTHPLIGPGTLGDSANILHAVDWVFEMAAAQPVVINASLGAHSGPHDGSSYAEAGIDRALELAPGRVMVNSAGNYFTKDAHASGRLTEGRPHTLRLFVPPNDPTPSELELWHSAVDDFTIHISPPGIDRPIPIKFGSTAKIRHDGTMLVHVTYGPRNNGDVALWAIFTPTAPEGVWSLTITPNRTVDGRFHAWIERDSGLQPRFVGDSVDPFYTTGTICNGSNTITVGAVDTNGTKLRLGVFSSSGPTRDGRIKPEVVAPGVHIVAARSAPPGSLPASRHVAKSGTSMAAPQVTGTIALMRECLGQAIPIAEMRRLLFSTLARANVADDDGRSIHRLGYGVLDIAAAERAARAWRAGHASQEVDQMNFTPETSRPEAAAEALPPDVFSEAMILGPDNNDGGYPDDHATSDATITDVGMRWPWEEGLENAPDLTDSWQDAGTVAEYDWQAPVEPMPARAPRPLDVTHEILGIDWVSDLAQEQADPFCQRRQDIARIARQEHRGWNTPRRLTENDTGRLPSLVQYWAATGRRPPEAQRLARLSAADRAAWSAAFICFVMQGAGIRRADGFNFSGAHISYIVGALRNRELSDEARPFWLVDSIELASEVRLQPGDLLCFNRRIEHKGRWIWTNHSYDRLRQQYWDGPNRNINPVSDANQRARITASHTSVVVGTRQRNGATAVQCIGGNEGNSVRLQEYTVNAGGGIDNPAAHRIFGAIKITRC